MLAILYRVGVQPALKLSQNGYRTHDVVQGNVESILFLLILVLEMGRGVHLHEDTSGLLAAWLKMNINKL